MIRDRERQFPVAVNYGNLREQLDTGDIAIFGGRYRLSKIIRLVTRFPASHVASILRDGERISFIEASEGDMYPEREGVIISRFSDAIPFYKGDIWIARLAPEIRARADIPAMAKFLREQVGKAYDYDNMPKAGFDLLDRIGLTHSRENWSKMFCSELVAAGLKAAGILGPNANTSEVSPADVIKLRIYAPIYYQIKAYDYKAIKLPEFNTIAP